MRDWNGSPIIPRWQGGSHPAGDRRIASKSFARDARPGKPCALSRSGQAGRTDECGRGTGERAGDQLLPRSAPRTCRDSRPDTATGAGLGKSDMPRHSRYSRSRTELTDHRAAWREQAEARLAGLSPGLSIRSQAQQSADGAPDAPVGNDAVVCLALTPTGTAADSGRPAAEGALADAGLRQPLSDLNTRKRSASAARRQPKSGPSRAACGPARRRARGVM